MTITTSKVYSKTTFDYAEDEQFSWSAYDGTSGKMLTHKPSGRQIYQMNWLNDDQKMTGRVEPEIETAVRAFRLELEALQSRKTVVVAKTEQVDDGRCPRCGTWCYGDCQAARF